MKRKMAVIGVGNMANAIISGILNSEISVESFFLYDKNTAACDAFLDSGRFSVESCIEDAVNKADCVLLSVKPQNYPEVIECIKTVPYFDKKLYISIGAGITSDSVSQSLNGAVVIRVLPNLPMTIGMGVSAICHNLNAKEDDFNFVKDVFSSAGSVTVIDEAEMNRIIGVTSSSPAYVFKFIDAICEGASAQNLNSEELLPIICDVVIGSAVLLKKSLEKPSVLIDRVASKGGTTERALLKLNESNFEEIIKNAMIACTNRADELGKQ